MRGAFDPPSYVENTERTPGLLLDSLLQFPTTYEFQLVLSRQAAPAGGGSDDGSSSSGSGTSGGSGGSAPDEQAAAAAALLERYRSLIADTTAADIPVEACTVKERLGGKYVSLTIPARVQAAHVVDLVWAALADDPAVKMKY